MPCEQLHRIGTVEVLSAVQARLPRLTSVEEVGCAKKNPRIENSESRGVEVWYLSSGKAMLFVRDRSLGKDIIRRVTTTALRDYPGVAVRGAMVKLRSFEVEGIANAVRDVHQAIEQKRSQLPPVDCRFQPIPFVAECKSSGLPAAGFVFEGTQAVAASTTAAAKRGSFDPQARENWKKTITDRLGEVTGESLLPAQTLDHLERWLGESRYLAVIHADGNGIGRLFQDFHNHCQPQGGRDYRVRLSPGLPAPT